MDNLILDAETLFAIADVISGYCAQQKETLNVYYAQIMALESEWRDDETFGAIAEEINKIKTNAVCVLDEINETYPKYFREKAQLILSRPTMQTTSGSMNTTTASVSGGSLRSSEHSKVSSNEYSKPGRIIPGSPGIVTGGDAAKLGKNMMSDMNISRKQNWGSSGYQAHHIIPKGKEISSHPVIQKIGMDMDDASNGIFLRTPNEGINTKSIHSGYHKEYSEAVKIYLDGLDLSQRVEVLEEKVALMQQRLKSSLENGLPIYKKKEDSTLNPVTEQHKGGGSEVSKWLDAISLSESDRDSFENRQYEIYQLTEPLVAYRYFGSYAPDEAKLNKVENENWGSDAGGNFLTTNPDLTSEQAKDLLALDPKWGNNATYIATIELPAGTWVAKGKAAPIKDKITKEIIKQGGETQIITLEEWSVDKIKARVKSCKPIDN